MSNRGRHKKKLKENTLTYTECENIVKKVISGNCLTYEELQKYIKIVKTNNIL